MSKTRNINFDIIRIMAAVLVFTVHLGQNTGYPSNAVNGFYGVWMFFILSGYLIFASLDKADGQSLKKYYLKRIIRIVPLYYAVLILIYLYDFSRSIIIDRMSIIDVIGRNGICGPKFFRYFLFGQMFIPSDNYDLWNNRFVLWTMSAFALFYLIAPLFKKIADSFYKSLVVLLAFYLVYKFVPGVIEEKLGGNPAIDLDSFASLNAICVMYLFFMGVSAYYAVKEHKELIYAVIITLSYVYYICRGTEFEVIFALMIMIAGACESVCLSEKVEKIVLLLSKCSFPLYLTHILCFDIITRANAILMIGNLPRTIIMVVVALPVAYVTYRVIDPIEKKLLLRLK